MATDISTRWANATLQHMSFLQRVENGAINNLVDTLIVGQKDIDNILNNLGSTVFNGGRELTRAEIIRLEQISRQIDSVLDASNVVLLRNTEKALTDFAGVEGGMITNIMNRQIPPSAKLKLIFEPLNVEQLTALVNSPLGGANYKQRLIRNFGQATQTIRSSLINSKLMGFSVGDASKALRTAVGNTLVLNTERMVRTEYARVANQVHSEVYKQNRDIIPALIWLSTLDLKVCIICGGLHGTEIPVDAPASELPPDRSHPNCRCTVGPKIKSMDELAKDLGLDRSDIPQNVQDLFTGNNPDISLSYEDWLRSRPVEDQIKMLGQSRFELWQNGLPLRDMAVDKRILKLSELEGLSGTVSTKAVVDLATTPIPAFTSVDDAIDFMQEGLDNFGVKVKGFQDMDLAVLTEQIRGLQLIARNSPRAFAQVKEISITSRSDIAGLWTGTTAQLSQTRYINKSFTSVNNFVDSQIKNKWWPAVETHKTANVLAHELGHALDSAYKSMKLTLMPNGISENSTGLGDLNVLWVRMTNGIRKKFDSKKAAASTNLFSFSRYAASYNKTATRTSEMLAESFMQMTLTSRTNWHPITRAVNEAVDTMERLAQTTGKLVAVPSRRSKIVNGGLKEFLEDLPEDIVQELRLLQIEIKDKFDVDIFKPLTKSEFNQLFF